MKRAALSVLFTLAVASAAAAPASKASSASAGALYAFGWNIGGQLGSSVGSVPTPTLITIPGRPGSLVRPGAAGTNSFLFTGRIGGRTLTPGAYQLTAAPAGGGAAQTSTFVILR